MSVCVCLLADDMRVPTLMSVGRVVIGCSACLRGYCVDNVLNCPLMVVGWLMSLTTASWWRVGTPTW